jgi:hypothetical protein
MAKRIPLEAKICAYNDAIDALEAHASDSDTPADIEARKWLAAKLDKEADRLAAKMNASSTTVPNK